jgi:hypothetical protein
VLSIVIQTLHSRLNYMTRKTRLFAPCYITLAMVLTALVNCEDLGKVQLYEKYVSIFSTLFI